MDWGDPDFEEVARRAARCSGMAIDAARRPHAADAVGRSMARAGLRDLPAYAALLEADPEAMADLLGELVVGETYFHREPAQFRHLRDVAIPEVRARIGPGATLRAWSAACATGEEAYSIAMTLAEADHAGPHRVLGSDLSERSLGTARSATYRPWSLRGRASDPARPYLTPRDGSLVVAESIRRRVAFRRFNLVQDARGWEEAGLRGLDVILCRNVLIYLDAQSVARVARRLHEALSGRGWLFVGAGDPPLSDHAPLALDIGDHGVAYRPLAAQAKARSAPRSAPPCAPAPGPVGSTPRALAATVRERANLDITEAQRLCAAAIAAHPLSAELHHLRGVLLLSGGDDAGSALWLRRAVYLDRSLAVAHFHLGVVLGRLGDAEGARRAFRNAHDLCAALPAGSPVPLADGLRVGDLAASARALAAGPSESRR